MSRELGQLKRLLGLGMVLVTLAAGAAAVAGGRDRDRTAASNAAVARADAASLLRRLQLPPGAERSAAEPAGDGSVLSQPATYPATPNLVDDHDWWTVPGAPSSVLAYIKAHLPVGSRITGSGSGAGPHQPPELDLELAWPVMPGVLSQRWLVVEVVPLPNGSTGLRADAEDVWLTPRPDGERIPDGVRRLDVVVRSFKGVRQSFMVASPWRVRRVVALIDSLPASQPGAQACPMDAGQTVRLSFYGRREPRPAAVAEIDPMGCEVEKLTIDGHHEPALTAEPYAGSGLPLHFSLIGRLDRALGVRLKVQSFALRGAAVAASRTRHWRGEISFAYPTRWRVRTFREPAVEVRWIAFVGNERMHDPCTFSHGGESCVGWPIYRLRPGSIVISWSSVGLPRWSLKHVAGKRTKVGGLRAKLQVLDNDCGLHASLELIAEIARPAPWNFYEFDACIRGPHAPALERQAKAVLYAARFREP